MPGRMIDGIGNRCGYTNYPEFAEAFGAERIDDGIMLFDEDHVDISNIRIHRYVIFRKVMVDEASEPLVHHAFFLQSHADAPHHSTDNLTSRRLWIQDASRRYRAHHAGNFD